MNNWKFSTECDTYQLNMLKMPNAVADICHIEEEGSDFTESLKETNIIVNNSENNDRTTEKVLSPIEKLVKYVQSPVREDNTDLINSLIDLSGSLESIGVEAHELTSILNETEKARLKLLKDNLKVGLSEKQFPIGYATLESIQPTAFIYKPLSVLSQKLENFTKNLETISETYADTKILYNELNTLGSIDIKNYVLTKQQKMGFYKLVMNDDRLSRAELDLLINFMKSSVFANSKALQQREMYYKNFSSDNESSFPDITPLLNDVKTLQSKLAMRLEEMPELLNKEEKKQLQQFLPALDEYYKDQIAAFSGGKSYLPLAKNLQNMQNEIKKNPVASNILEHSESLGFTMQRLYMLHWVAESLMKRKYNSTLGTSLGLYAKEYPDKADTFSFLRNAVNFRNDVAHNGKLWSPEDFENHIKTYEQGIPLIAKELQIDLAKFDLEKVHRPLNKEELKTSILEKFDVGAFILNSIDKKLLKSPWSEKHCRLKELFNILNEKNISVEKILELDSHRFINFYNSKKDKLEIFTTFNNSFFLNAFAKKYFSYDSFNSLVDNTTSVQQNSQRDKIHGWLFKLAMLEKENKMDYDTLGKIHDLKKELNG